MPKIRTKTLAPSKPRTDFLVTSTGSVWLFQPLTTPAADFVDAKIPLEPWQWQGTPFAGGSFAVEARYAADLLVILETEDFAVVTNPSDVVCG